MCKTNWLHSHLPITVVPQNPTGHTARGLGNKNSWNHIEDESSIINFSIWLIDVSIFFGSQGVLLVLQLMLYCFHSTLWRQDFSQHVALSNQVDSGAFMLVCSLLPAALLLQVSISLYMNVMLIQICFVLYRQSLLITTFFFLFSCYIFLFLWTDKKCSQTTCVFLNVSICSHVRSNNWWSGEC